MKTLLQRLHAAAQGVALGAQGAGWAPEELYEPAAQRIERLTATLEAIDSCLEERDGRLQVVAGNGAHFWEAIRAARKALAGEADLSTEERP
jgi:hypothetical protein